MKMKKTIATLVFAAVSSVFITVSNAGTVYLGSDTGNWGTAFSDVHKDAYAAYLNNGIDPSTGKPLKLEHDSWEKRFSMLESYLSESLGSNKMLNTTNNAKESKPNTGLLAESTHIAGHHDTYTDKSKNTYKSIYGKKADAYDKDAADKNGALAVKEAWSPLLREDSTTHTVLSVSTSPTNDSSDHHWTYDAATDKMSVEKKTTAGSAGDHNTGIYAFVTGFTYNSSQDYDYLNGWFSVLGDFVGVYINGFSLMGSDYLWMGNDTMDSAWFSSWDMEIDLAALFAEGILKEGDNNISYVVDAQPMYYFTDNLGTVTSSINQYDDAAIAFAAGIALNTESLNGGGGSNVTPEPATMLIFGLGTIAAGAFTTLRRKRK